MAITGLRFTGTMPHTPADPMGREISTRFPATSVHAWTTGIVTHRPKTLAGASPMQTTTRAGTPSR